MKKLSISLFSIIIWLTLGTNVYAKTHHFSIPNPTPHTYVCQGADGPYTADNSVGCAHECTLSDGTTYWAAAGLACATQNSSVDLGQMPTQHDHTCMLSDGITYETDNSVACPAL